MEHYNMKSPLLDVLGFSSLLLALPWLHWLLLGEPYMKALCSYGGAVVVVWRAVVLSSRMYGRWRARHRATTDLDKKEQDK